MAKMIACRNCLIARSSSTQAYSQPGNRARVGLRVNTTKQTAPSTLLFKQSPVSGTTELAALKATRKTTVMTCSRSPVVTRASGEEGRLSSVPVMINDCSGKMGHAVAEAAVEAGLTLVPFALTGNAAETVACGGVAVKLVGVDEDRDALMEKLKVEYPGMIVVDYTVPVAAEANAEFYTKHGLSFVMGTTGADSAKMASMAKDAGVHAVIAPQMGKQVVAFQAAMELMAEQFPGAFSTYKLRVVESHQSTKVDTSGTAKAIVSSFQKLGCKFDVEDIEKVRTANEQTNVMGVPEAHLKGHAFHTYELTSPDGQVQFKFEHNVCGRSIYAQGTVDAVLFLHSKVQAKASKQVYDMIDVLREGDMRD
mmetsp:Transcript_39307/g.47604  ORF Transcript_39307/g.47604 Transcript_39307/m.47604 type:complete len:366 (-) Transcript_39307:487-1584(-)|eukprot:CAMPEP_0197861508 /NCGR_PEP_ID=MMETSP1438-20131217/37613_1 /TAXON_ID=1461541 /ORGANISM="Pterosperma sp., Strain CCMP1384" /LENGTH=365 /DNA_ID=CAMNT_0043478707 /DNA_START=62 /DNA_END=1159 /DNA_ORIENTATION=-